MNQNLLYIVARHNVERIYGDGRLSWIDDDWAECVVAVGGEIPGRTRGILKNPATGKRELAARLWKGRRP